MTDSRLYSVGAVSYLNSVPLIAGLDTGTSPVRLSTGVPSALLSDLLAGATQVALCPVIDYQRSSRPLAVVPEGGIGCAGPTLTVRLFSRLPVDSLHEVWVDPDSHTSVALLEVLLVRIAGRRPRLRPLADPLVAANGSPPEACLLIGDKVVTAAPGADLYPHQLDLGEAWHELTGLPFVFAVWMSVAGAELGDLPTLLRRQREANATRVGELARQRAAAHGWPAELAEHYLGSLLRYHIGDAELAAIERFWRECHALGLVETLRPLVLA